MGCTKNSKISSLRGRNDSFVLAQDKLRNLNETPTKKRDCFSREKRLRNDGVNFSEQPFREE